MISTRSGSVDRSFADTDANLAVAVPDGRRGWFVGGIFTCVGGTAEPGLARLNRDGSLDSAWHAQLPRQKGAATGYGQVIGLALHGDTLYVAGGSGVEALERATGRRKWLARVTALHPVAAVVATPRAIYVAGAFTRIANRPRDELAALAPDTGKVLPWHAPAIYPDTSQITSLGLDGERLFIGGTFARVGDKPRLGLAALDARTGTLSAWKTPVLDPVDRILVTDGRVFTSGHDEWGVWNARTAAPDPWAPRVAGSYFAAAGATVYVGGDCRNGLLVRGRAHHGNLVAIDLATGRIKQWTPHIRSDACVEAIAATADDVLLSFATAAH